MIADAPPVGCGQPHQAFGGFQRDAGFDGTLGAVSQLATLPGRMHYEIMETAEVAALVER